MQNTDRIEALRRRATELRAGSVDPQFSAYLDQVLSNLEDEENTIHKLERHMEQNYQFYLRRNARVLNPQQFTELEQPVQPQNATEPAEQQNPVQPMPQMPDQQWMPQQQTQQVQWQPQTVSESGARSIQQVTPQMQNQQWMPQTQPMPPYINPQQQQPPAPANHAESKSWEFKIGTFVLGLVGIVFILAALVVFFMNYASTILQGVLFYAISIAIFTLSELFLSKRLEKFSYFTSGLGIAGIYITTILNYLYLKIIPSWAALLITVVVTGFFFWLSMKKDSGMIRVICLLGCYISLVPLGDLENLSAFILPAVIIFVLNLAGFLCPIRHGNQVMDYIQYICTVALSFRMVYLLYISGLEMWPFYIFICGNILTLHLLCYKKLEQIPYQILYSLMFGVFNGFLLYVGNHEKWMPFGAIGLSVLCVGFIFLFRESKNRFAPYFFTAVYVLLAFAFDGDSFNLTIVCMIIFVINRLLAVFTEKFAIVDAVYTMFAVWGVSLGCRTDELQMLGYIFACLILIGAFFVTKMKRYHLYLAVSFAWLFLVTERMYPLICSVLICVLAACMIGGGFLKKEKAVRIYGLCLMIFVSLKLAAYDFKDAEALTRILVFAIVGLVILGVSFLYIYLEKKQSDEKLAAAMPANMKMPVQPDLRMDLYQPMDVKPETDDRENVNMQPEINQQMNEIDE